MKTKQLNSLSALFAFRWKKYFRMIIIKRIHVLKWHIYMYIYFLHLPNSERKIEPQFINSEFNNIQHGQGGWCGQRTVDIG